jgi:hypothetical protein
MTEEHIKFSTIREDFNEYQIENRLLLKVKPVLTDIIPEIKNDETGFKTIFEKISKVIGTPEKDPLHVLEENEKYELQFIPIKEVVNLYETDKMIILVLYKVEKVFYAPKQDKHVISATDNTFFNFVQKPTGSTKGVAHI